MMHGCKIALFGSACIVSIIPGKKNAQWYVNFKNFDKSINKLCFFIPREMCRIFVSVNNFYSTFLQQIATASLQKAFKNIANQKGHSRHSMLLAIGTCTLVFLYNMCHDWKKI